jgi:hypothetical protein
MVPSGRLVLRVRSKYYDDRRQLRDQNRRAVEERLNEFIVNSIARHPKSRDLKQERERIEREEREKRRKERELDRLMANWHKAQDIREFMAAIGQAHAGTGSIGPESDLAEWIAWAFKRADKIDPLVGRASPGSNKEKELLPDEETGTSQFIP